jgi:hypothetical protein
MTGVEKPAYPFLRDAFGKWPCIRMETAMERIRRPDLTRRLSDEREAE